jgi:hypothetical protein
MRYETDPPNPGALLGAQSERPSRDCADRNCGRDNKLIFARFSEPLSFRLFRQHRSNSEVPPMA